MFFLFLGFSLSLASTALAGCPDVGIAAVFSDRYSGNIGCVAQNNMPPTFTRGTWPRGLNLSSTIVLDFPLLLDRPTPRLPGIKIVSGGRLVFSPHARDVSLTTDFIQVAIVIVLLLRLSHFDVIQIEDGGSLEIGSSDCPFEGHAEILLTGKKLLFSFFN